MGNADIEIAGLKSGRHRVIAVLGPTAAGKSALGLALAERLGGEIVNCDSTAVYRGFDIGTDKVPAADQRGIPHHLIDIVEPTAEYSAADYARDATAVIRDILARGRVPILVGGTGFYYPGADARAVPGPGQGRSAAGAARMPSPSAAAWRGCGSMVRRVDPESARADSAARSRCAWSARSRSTS